jgi:hypothetical protein
MTIYKTTLIIFKKKIVYKSDTQQEREIVSLLNLKKKYISTRFVYSFSAADAGSIHKR